MHALGVASFKQYLTGINTGRSIENFPGHKLVLPITICPLSMMTFGNFRVLQSSLLALIDYCKKCPKVNRSSG